MERTVDKPFVIGYVSSPHPHAPMHMKTLEALADVADIHLCGLEGEDVQALGAGNTKVRSTTGSIDDLLKRKDIDALLVCVRNDLCPGVLDAAVAAGKPVLFEKPGALTAAALRAVAARASAKGLTMGTMLQWRGHPIVLDIRQAIAEGALGPVMAVEGRLITSQVRYRTPSHWLFGKNTAGSGILSWLGCHYLDLLCYLLDDRVAEVTAMVANRNPERLEVEDTAMVVMKFAGGVLGTLHTGYHLSGSQSGYAGASSDSFIALRGVDGHIRFPVSEGSEYTIGSIAPGWAAGGKRKRSFQPADSPAYGGVAGEQFVLDFLTASRTGAPAPAPIEGMVHVLEIIEAALESSATGRRVEIPA